MLVVLERLAVVIVLVFFVTQLIVPCFVPNLRFFWLFKKSEKSIRKREEQLAAIKDLQRAAELDRVIDDELKNIDKIKNPVKDDGNGQKKKKPSPKKKTNGDGQQNGAGVTEQSVSEKQESSTQGGENS